MATKISIFPLELILFPQEKLNLHIFEPRYKQLITDVQEHQVEYGIPYYQRNQQMQYGCSAELLSITKVYDDGKMDIKNLGKAVFKILEIHKNTNDLMYSYATVEYIEQSSNPDISTTQKLSDLIDELYSFMRIDKSIPEIQSPLFSFLVGHHVGLSKEQEFQLLTINAEEKRQDFLLNHLTELIPVVKEMETLRKKVEMNGHFKNLKPPLF
jgi:Lon protease-like protein